MRNLARRVADIDEWDLPVVPGLTQEQRIKVAAMLRPGEPVTIRTPSNITQTSARLVALNYTHSKAATVARLAGISPVPAGTFQGRAFCTVEDIWKVALCFEPA
jgi:hypothetical protein